MYILLLLLSLSIGAYSFYIKIIKSPIFNIPPKINLHHIVVLYENTDSYTLDFSPTNQFCNTLFKLTIGQNVDSHIKIKYIKLNDRDYNTIGSKKYIDIWSNQSIIVVDDIINIDIKNFVYKHYNITKKMNLYKFNCQHYAKIVYNDYMNNKNM